MKLNELQGSDREEDVSSSGTMKPKATEGSDFKVDIPTFEGKNDPDEFLEWLETVERVFDFKDVSDEKKVKIVALKFQKYASTWWTNTCTKRRRNDKEQGKKKGVPVPLDEVIIHTKTKKHNGKTWVDPGHGELQAKFFELREEA
ncbi:unnamed protein product [Cuscuta campestris]|uniref:Retrotransposon gag domain-containing protein n=1 Tax=Cuscuta campestris TaxID=132261 RepID=A0A484M2A2_9ASTE|nr:unnamed protein product [Cuscuta campestris]